MKRDHIITIAITAGLLVGSGFVGTLATSQHPVEVKTAAATTDSTPPDSSQPTSTTTTSDPVSLPDPVQPATTEPTTTTTDTTSSTAPTSSSTTSTTTTSDPAPAPAPTPTVVHEDLRYVDSPDKPNYQDAYCTYTFSDGSTQERWAGTRPTPGSQPGVFILECPIFRG